MSEMLANQYFLFKKYNLAAKELEHSLEASDGSKLLIKKLIICYTQINKPREALEMFAKLAESDFDFIMNTDPTSEDCPCFELIDRIKYDIVKYENLFTKYYVMGMLSLYCDFNSSRKFFSEALKIEPEDKNIIKIIKLLNDKTDKIN
jgi:tetratricopeptide (TPR) repeat protein